MSLKERLSKNSENIGGAVSLVGSTIVLANGDVKSIVSAAFFTAAEIVFMKAGHKIGGYAAGSGLFAAGDLTLAFSPAAEGKPLLQASLIAMTAVWTLAAARLPAHLLGFEKTANAIPKIAGASSLALRIPGIAAAGLAGQFIIATAITCWGASDVLTGRLQEMVKPLFRKSDHAAEPAEPSQP